MPLGWGVPEIMGPWPPASGAHCFGNTLAPSHYPTLHDATRNPRVQDIPQNLGLN